jgi:hypothetical protein
VQVSAEALSAAGGARWSERLRYGRDFHVLTFGPAAPAALTAPRAGD